MDQLKNTLLSLIALTALAANVGALAQDQNCIQLTTTGETEQEYVNEQGQKATRLVPPAKVVPGQEIIWTVTAKNACSQPTAGIVIDNPVPEHMKLVPASVMGTGTTITYSLDGKTFKPAGELSVRESDGSTRAARADEYRAVRWAFATAFPPGSTAFVRYRATVD